MERRLVRGEWAGGGEGESEVVDPGHEANESVAVDPGPNPGEQSDRILPPPQSMTDQDTEERQEKRARKREQTQRR